MKSSFDHLRFPSVILFALVLMAGLLACGPGANTPSTNNSTTTTPTTSSSATPGPSPSPSASTAPCDDNGIDQKLKNAFTAPGNQGGPNGFGKIQGTVNFFAQGCEIYLWGYTKNLGTFKRLIKVFGDESKAARDVSLNMENLFITQNEYEPGAPAGGQCAAGYKPCNDICIPEGDSCWNQMAAGTPNPGTGTGNQNRP